MWRHPSICAMLVATGLIVMSLSDAEAQRRGYYSGRLNTQQLLRRIEQLERRVTVLERTLPQQKPEAQFATSVEVAEQQLVTARERQAFSEKLYGKGYISEAEMESDRFEAVRALKVLQFTEAVRDGKPTAHVTHEIEILEAEYDLAFATRQLRHAEGQMAKGLAGTDLVAHRRAVEEAQRRLDELKASQ